MGQHGRSHLVRPLNCGRSVFMFSPSMGKWATGSSNMTLKVTLKVVVQGHGRSPNSKNQYYHQTSLNITCYRSKSPIITQCHQLSLNNTSYHSISLTIAQYHKLSLNITKYRSISFTIAQ